MTNSSVKVSEIVQKVVLDVNSAGTEAAAATGVELVPFSSSFGVNLDININRPFIMILQDIENKVPVLVGKIMDPRGNVGLQHFNGEKLRRMFVPNFN